MNKLLKTLFVISIIFSYACRQQQDEPIRLGINPWPGYEFLYLADQKGFYKDVGLNIEIVEFSSLADVQRAYINGRVDGMASTLIEVVGAMDQGAEPMQVVLIPDFSNGADVIIGHGDINSVKQLKGKRVGVELASLGMFMLARALDKADLTLDDVTLVNTEQTKGEEELVNNNIDAFITYPPSSINIMKNDNMHIIFTSSDIPYEVVDSVAFSKTILEKNPELSSKMRLAWDKSLTYSHESKSSQQESFAIMAKREQISVEEFADVLSGLTLINEKQQAVLFSNTSSLQNTIMMVCTTLEHSNSITNGCDQFTETLF